MQIPEPKPLPPPPPPHRTGTTQGIAKSPKTSNYDPVNPQTVPFGVPPEIDTLIVEDSDSEEDQPRLARKATSALSVVRSKLTRHLPMDGGDKRQSHISVRNSQEEIARRAELRRLRHRRIQDELHQEPGGDDASGMSRKTLRDPHSLTSLHQACIGPRDFIEFTVPGKGNRTIDSNSSKCSIKSKGSPETGQQDRKGYAVLKQENPLTKKHAKEEHLWPARVRQCEAPLRTSQPCSPGTMSKRSLQPKSAAHVGTESSVAADSFLREDDQSTLGVWLMAQAMQSEDTGGICSGSDQTVVRNDNLSQHSSIIDEQDKIKTSRRRPSQVSTHSPSQPEHRASSASQRPSPSSGKHVVDQVSQREEECESDILQFFPIFARSLLEDPVEVIPPQTDTKPDPENGSSKYASLRPSFQPSPSRSQLNINHLSLRDLRGLDLSPFHCEFLLGRSANIFPNFDFQGHTNSSFLQDPGRSEDPSSYATAEDRQSSHEMEGDMVPTAWRSSPLHADASSATQSETPSFRKREAELQTIQARFGDVLSRRKLPATFQSRFKEDFSDPDPSNQQHSSLLSKIHIKSQKSAGKASKYSHLFGNWSAGSLEYSPDRKGVTETEPKRLSTATLRSSVDPDAGKSSEVLPVTSEHHIPWWEKAIQPGQSKKRASATDVMREPKPRNIQQSPEEDRTLSLSHQVDSSHLLPDSRMAIPMMELPVRTDYSKQVITPRIDESPLGSHWPALAENPASTPSSWMNYPLHLFEERNGPATFKDHVMTHDFAVGATASETRSDKGSDDKTTANSEADLASKPPLQGRIGRVLRSSFSKLVPRMDPKRHIIEQPVSGMPTTARLSAPQEDTPVGKNTQDKPRLDVFDGASGNFPVASAMTEPSLQKICAPKILDIAHAAGGSPEPARRLLSIQNCSEPVLPHFRAAGIYNATSKMSREDEHKITSLRPIMSDFSLHHARRDFRASGKNCYQRSFTCPGRQQLSDGDLVALQKKHAS